MIANEQIENSLSNEFGHRALSTFYRQIFLRNKMASNKHDAKLDLSNSHQRAFIDEMNVRPFFFLKQINNNKNNNNWSC